MKHVLLVLLLAVAACATAPASPEDQFREGVSAVEPTSTFGRMFRDCRTAATQLRRFIDEHPFDARAPQAQAKIARCYVAEGSWLDAENAWKSWIALYPGHADLPAALLGLGNAQWEQRDSADRDQNKIRQAAATYARVIREFPKSKQGPLAASHYQAIREELAHHDWLVGEFYLHQGDRLAALTRFAATARQYPETKWGKKAIAMTQELRPGD